MPEKVDLYGYTRFHKSIPHESYYPVISNVAMTIGGLVTWTTDIPSTSQVIYGFVPSLGFKTDYDSSLVTSHSVQLPLTSDGYYYLKVQSFYFDSLSISDLYVFVFTNVATQFFLQEDGSSFILLEDGTSRLGLED